MLAKVQSDDFNTELTQDSNTLMTWPPQHHQLHQISCKLYFCETVVIRTKMKIFFLDTVFHHTLIFKNWPMLQPYISLKCLLEFSEEPKQLDLRYEEHLNSASTHFFQHHKSARNSHGNFLGSTFQ